MKKDKHPHRRRWRRALIGTSVLLAFVALILAGSLAYLRFGDLSRHRELCESLVSDYLGRDLAINGVFKPTVAGTVTLVAGDITLGNAAWGQSRPMVHIDHLALSLDLFSLFSGPVVIHEIELRGIQVNLESDTDGRGNWELDLPQSEEPATPATGPVLFMEDVLVEDLALFYVDADSDQPLELIAERIELRGAKEKPFNLEFLGSLDTVPVSLSGKAGPLDSLMAGQNVQVDLAGALGSAQWTLKGKLEDLALLSGMKIQVTLAGTDLKAVTEAFELEELGEGPFRFAAAVSPLPEGYSLNLTADASDVAISIDSAIDSLLDPQALRASVEISAPNLAALGALFGLDGLPAEPVKTSGRVNWGGGSIRFEELHAEAGANLLDVDGVLGEFPGLLGTDFQVSAQGPDLGAFSSLAGVELPAGEFRVQGRVLQADAGIEVEAMKITMGRAALEIEGFIGDLPDHVGTDLSIKAAGPDLSVFQGLAGSELPAESFEFGGNLQHRAIGVALEGVEARLGDARLRVSGTLVFDGSLVGTRLRLDGEAPDLAEVAFLAGQSDWPEGAISIMGNVDVTPDGYALEDAQVKMANVVLSVEGLVGHYPALNGSDLRFDVGGQDLAAFSSLAGVELPAGAFRSEGRVLRADTGVQIEAMNFTLGRTALKIEGFVGDPPEYVGSTIRFEVAGPDLSFFQGLAGVPLPARLFEAGGSLQYRGVDLVLDGVTARLGDARLRASGTLALADDLVGTALQVEAEGPDLAEIDLLLKDSGIRDVPELPAGPFSAGGTLAVDDAGYLLRGVTISVDPGIARVDGHISLEPGSESDLTLSARGPDLSRVGVLVDFELPAVPFDLSSRVMGTPDQFSLTDLVVQVGDSDLAGSMRVGLGSRPDLDGTFTSTYLDISAFLPDPREEDELAMEPEPVEKDAGRELVRVIPDDPFELGALHSMNINLRIDADRLVASPLDAHQVRLGVQLQDGALLVDPLDGRAPDGGTVSGSLELEPDGESYRIRLRLIVDDFKIDLTEEQDDPELWPSFDADLELQGEGSTPHQLAAGLSGGATLVVGPGQMDSSQMDILTADILLKLFTMLNPFAKDDKVTQLDCIVLAGVAEDGDLRLDPVVMATDKMVILGDGKIDLDTEEIALDWVTKPRKGIGISASALTNALIKLGGTLSDPKIQSKGLEGAAKGSLSILTLGIADRIAAEKNLCKKARKMIARNQ
jgi:uncharacterized protein involved in outer membrane biogenesis